MVSWGVPDPIYLRLSLFVIHANQIDLGSLKVEKKQVRGVRFPTRRNASTDCSQTQRWSAVLSMSSYIFLGYDYSDGCWSGILRPTRLLGSLLFFYLSLSVYLYRNVGKHGAAASDGYRTLFFHEGK